MKKALTIMACLLLVFGVYLSYTTVDTQTPTAVAKHAETKTYSGTVYVAGMGGHFSAAKVEIDPADTVNPIKVVGLDRVVIGDKSSHPTHDPRIDVNDKTKMYWSTYKPDKNVSDRSVHVGLSDLKSGDVLMDKTIELDKRATWTGALYCASGQSKKYYMPVTMTDEAYIDVFDKKDLSLEHRVFLDYKPGETLFYHGINDDNMTKFAVAINRKSDGKPNGNIDMLMLDLQSLEKGKAKVIAKNKVTGTPGETLTFRQDFTPDGKYLLQSGADRFYLLDGETLDLVDEELLSAGQNHDAISTPDGKYAILTLRTKIANPMEQGEAAQVTDGGLQLYDIDARTVVGNPASVCIGCHSNIGISGNAVLCGADVNWN